MRFQVLINQLLDRGIELFHPAPVIEVCVDKEYPCGPHWILFHEALITFYGLVNQKKPLKLCTRDRAFLNQIEDLVRWKVTEDVTSGIDGKLILERLNKPKKPYWRLSNHNYLSCRYETYIWAVAPRAA